MHLFVLLTLFVGVFACPSVSAADEPAVPRTLKSIPRIRPADSRVAVALEQGRQRSASFRSLVDRVNERDVIVYVEIQPLQRHHLAGAMLWVTATKDFRYVRVLLSPELGPQQIVAALAHELQHVLEVGEEPSIVDTRSLSEHYRVAGVENPSKRELWETEAAQRVGETVRRELAASYNGDADTLRARRSASLR